MSPACGRDTNQKNETRIALTLHGLVFSRIHFLIIFRQWYLDFGLDLAGFASAGALPFQCMIGWCNRECHQMLFRKRECHKHSQIHENPQINPKNTGLRKNQWKVKSVSSVKSVFNFLSIAEGWWTTLLSLIYLFMPCCHCVPDLRQGHKSKN